MTWPGHRGMTAGAVGRAVLEDVMAKGMTRRETLRRGVAAAGALALVPDWALPALAQGEVDVPFTDAGRALAR
jgi:hypothetical protein